MGTSRQTMDFLLDQLDRALPITTRKMFGEYCVYWDGKLNRPGFGGGPNS